MPPSTQRHRSNDGSRLPGKDVTLIAEFIDANELGLALEQFADALSEDGLPPEHRHRPQRRIRTGASHPHVAPRAAEKFPDALEPIPPPAVVARIFNGTTATTDTEATTARTPRERASRGWRPTLRGRTRPIGVHPTAEREAETEVQHGTRPSQRPPDKW